MSLTSLSALASVSGFVKGNPSLDLYKVLDFSPELVFDFDDEYYRTSRAKTTFESAISHNSTTAMNGTMVDSDGLLKWRPHNLFAQSEGFNESAWVETLSGVGTITSRLADQGLSPEGTMTADRVVFDLNGGTTTNDIALLRQQLPSAGQTISMGVWLRSYNGTSSYNMQIINPDGTGKAITVTGDWQFFTATTGVSAGPVNYGIRLRGGQTPINSDSADILMWGARAYRSDLGGMVNNPDRGDSYVPTTDSPRYLPRRGHHVYNGSTWVNEGLLVESEARTNLALYSNDISNTAVGWTANDTLVAPATGIIGIDGVSGSPFKLIAGSSGGFQFRSNQTSVTSGTDYTLCAILKDAGDGVYACLVGLGIGSANEVPVFDLVNGTVDIAGTTTVVKEAGIYPWNDDGWYFCWARVTSGGSSGISLGLAQNATDNTSSNYLWVGDNTSGYYVAYAGCEQTSGMPSVMPIPTSDATVTRGAETLTVAAADLPYPTPRVIGEEKWNTPTISDPAVWSWDGSTLTGTGDGTSDTANGDAVTAGGVYLITYNVTKVSGLCQVRLGNSFIETIGPNGLREKIVVAANSTGLSFTDSGSFIGTIDNISVREIDPLSVSIQMDGRMTYADEGNDSTVFFTRWIEDSNNFIYQRLRTDSTYTGSPQFLQRGLGATPNQPTPEIAPGSYSPGILVPYNISSRHGSTFINGAVDGVEVGEDVTPTALPDLSATDLNLALTYMGTIRTFRMWAKDLGDTGIEAATQYNRWILFTGIWLDNTYWVDAQTWNDGV